MDEEGVAHPTDCCAHEMMRPYDFNRMEGALTRAGVQRAGGYWGGGGAGGGGAGDV